jgi:hypothetical protein
MLAEAAFISGSSHLITHTSTCLYTFIHACFQYEAQQAEVKGMEFALEEVNKSCSLVCLGVLAEEI